MTARQGREWRVQYRRAHWAPTTTTKSRLFSTRIGAEMYADAVARRGASLVKVSVRTVGPWRDGWR